MIDHNLQIALVTPLKDEIDNIAEYISNIEHQTIPIKCLVIVENDSTDGSKEYLEKIESVRNVDVFKVLNISFEDKSYRVGKKYSTIIDAGMEFLRKSEFYSSLDFIGILDCDVFPENAYYSKLTTFMNSDPKIGIASGLTYTNEGVLHIADTDFVRGNSRLWKRECLDEAGYVIAHTADTVSVALAHLKGWRTRTLKSASVTSREIDVRLSNPKSKGYHAYYRGHTLFYILLKSLYYSIVKGRCQTGYDVFSGYISALFKRKPRIANPEVKNYFKNYMYNKLLKKYNQ